MHRIVFNLIIASLAVLLSPVLGRAQSDSWGTVRQRLRGVEETYRKWGITFEIDKKKSFTDGGELMPGTLKVKGSLESPDTARLDMEVGLGRQDALALAVSGVFKISPDGNAVTGNGMVTVKGTGIGMKYKYTRENGYEMETGVEETFYSLGVKIGGDGRNPVKFGLKLGPATIKIDPLVWATHCATFLSNLPSKGVPKVGGVLIRTDLGFLAAALADAPPPETLRLRDVTIVSLKRLLPAIGKPSTTNLGDVTTIVGVAIDGAAGDVLLIGRNEPGKPAVPVDILISLLRAVYKRGDEPFVSLDPASDPNGRLELRPRVGGLPDEDRAGLLVETMLDADYETKTILYGGVSVPGITSLPAALARERFTTGAGAARIWFSPRPLEYGDIRMLKTSGAAVYTFDSEPQILTERLTGPFSDILIGDKGEESAANVQSDQAFDRIMSRIAAEITGNYPQLEQDYPELRLKPLRQAFEIATAAAILRRAELPRACAELLDSYTRLQVYSAPNPKEFEPKVVTIKRDEESGIRLWGGVTLGTEQIQAARARADRSLTNLLSDIQSSSWDGWTKAVSGAFDPVIADEEAVDEIEMAEASLSIAEHYLRENSPREAIVELNRILESNPDLMRAHFLRGGAYMMVGDRPRALTDADAAVRLAPEDPRAHYLRAVVVMDFLGMQEAMPSINAAIRLSPTFGDAYIIRGNFFIRIDPKRAVADFDQALKYVTRTGPVYVLRGLARKELNDEAGALADFSSAIAADPRNVGAYDNRAELFKKQKRYAEAADDTRHAIALAPSSKRFSELAGTLTFLHDNGGAISAATRALELDSKNGSAYVARAIAKQASRDFDGAIADYQAAIPLMGDWMRELLLSKIEDCRAGKP